MLQSSYFRVSELESKKELKEMKKGLNTLYGVLSVEINAKDNSVGVDYDTTGVTGEQISHYLKDRGYQVTNVYDLNA